jgi:tRNA (cytidine/uridine-2'-O-)-methyltransferase
MRLALYQPDIPQNVGSAVRLAACMGVPLDIIEPCGFPFDDKRLRRVAMDYYDRAQLMRHASWQAFAQARAGRIVAVTNQSPTAIHTQFAFHADDTLLLGQETRGLPPEVLADLPHRVLIPMREGIRSLNVITAAAMALGEALRQTGGYATTGVP